MKKKERRMLTVHASRQRYASLNEAPCIILEGVWLNELGYRPGDRVDVRTEDGRLTISRINPADIPEDPEKKACREEVGRMSAKQRKMMAAMLRDAM